MVLDGISDLFPFLEFLKGRKIWHELVQQSRPEVVTVEIVLPGLRSEVNFFDGRVEYTCFTGDEGVLDDQGQLYNLITSQTVGPALRGIVDLLAFLEFLDAHHIRFKFGYSRPEALTVEIALPDSRVEVDFFDDHIEYSNFDRDKSIEGDQKKLFDLLIELGE